MGAFWWLGAAVVAAMGGGCGAAPAAEGSATGDAVASALDEWPRTCLPGSAQVSDEVVLTSWAAKGAGRWRAMNALAAQRSVDRRVLAQFEGVLGVSAGGAGNFADVQNAGDSRTMDASVDTWAELGRLAGVWLGAERDSPLGPVRDEVVIGVQGNQPVIVWATLPRVGPPKVVHRYCWIDPRQHRVIPFAQARALDYQLERRGRLTLRCEGGQAVTLVRAAVERRQQEQR